MEIKYLKKENQTYWLLEIELLITTL
jgi:hypothetical protein